MCKSQAEGGQRCAGHCRERVAKAQSRFDTSGSGEDLHELLLAETDLASTPDGHTEAVRKAAAGEPGPGGLPSEYWTRIADNGDALREKNGLIAGAVKKAACQAFHAKAVDRLGVFQYLPDWVQGPKSLERYLDGKTVSVREYVSTVCYQKSQLAGIDSIITRLASTQPDPAATYESGTPRSQEEKTAWSDELAYRRRDPAWGELPNREDADDGLRELANGGRDTSAFLAEMDAPPTPSGGYQEGFDDWRLRDSFERKDPFPGTVKPRSIRGVRERLDGHKLGISVFRNHRTWA